MKNIWKNLKNNLEKLPAIVTTIIIIGITVCIWAPANYLLRKVTSYADTICSFGTMATVSILIIIFT